MEGIVIKTVNSFGKTLGDSEQKRSDRLNQWNRVKQECQVTLSIWEKFKRGGEKLSRNWEEGLTTMLLEYWIRESWWPMCLDNPVWVQHPSECTLPHRTKPFHAQENVHQLSSTYYTQALSQICSCCLSRMTILIYNYDGCFYWIYPHLLFPLPFSKTWKSLPV